LASGRISNSSGQATIRRQQQLDLHTREVAAKLLQVSSVPVVFLLLLHVMGVNLTALAVFGGAVGVGLSVGLQAIASNFISGIIILLDCSVAVNDYIQRRCSPGTRCRSIRLVFLEARQEARPRFRSVGASSAF
jgi:small-conductance mechanosensitive channel